jgi:hypothetical protein
MFQKPLEAVIGEFWIVAEESLKFAGAAIWAAYLWHAGLGQLRRRCRPMSE